MWVSNSIKWQKWHSCSHSIASQKHKNQKIQESAQVSLEEPASPLPTLAAAGDFSTGGDHNITHFIKNLCLWDSSSHMMTLKYSLNSECLGKQFSPHDSPQRADVCYQNLTERASAGLEYNCENLPWQTQSWSNPIFQDSFHEQITFRVQFWSSIFPYCFAWKPETQTPEMSLSCENWGRTCSVILRTKISIFLASV